MSGTAETYVRALLKTMATKVDAIVCNNVMTERLHSDYAMRALPGRITAPAPSSKVVEVYALQRLRGMRKRLLEQYTLSPEDLKRSTTEFLLWVLVASHSARLPSELPKLHHWLPLCYTKQFASRVMSSARAAIIQQVWFDADGNIQKTHGVWDTHFAHEKTEKGYYPARIEQFFGRVEAAYSSLSLNSEDKNAWTEVVAFAFFLVQSVRNPDPKGVYFRPDHRSSLIPNLFAAIDQYERPFISFARDCENLWFSPFFPPRVRKTVTGVMAAVFPMNPHTAMVVTDEEISDFEAHRIATSNAAAMVRHAVRKNKSLFGVLPEGTKAG